MKKLMYLSTSEHQFLFEVLNSMAHRLGAYEGNGQKLTPTDHWYFRYEIAMDVIFTVKNRNADSCDFERMAEIDNDAFDYIAATFDEMKTRIWGYERNQPELLEITQNWCDYYETATTMM